MTTRPDPPARKADRRYPPRPGPAPGETPYVPPQPPVHRPSRTPTSSPVGSPPVVPGRRTPGGGRLSPAPSPDPPRPIVPADWAYGVTTCKARLDNLLPRTLASLAAGGFPAPRLFVDGAGCRDGARAEDRFGLPVSVRGADPVRTAGNWVLTLYELYLRTPVAARYAVFQDDFVTCPGLKDYLSAACVLPYAGPKTSGRPGGPGPLVTVDDPAKVYWNLYTFPSNASLAPAGFTGFYPSNQLGRGAVALIFPRAAVLDLLSSQFLAERPADPGRGHRAIDGGVVTALRKVGYTELVHAPSLVQHTGDVSSMKNRPHPKAADFPGETFDLRTLLGGHGRSQVGEQAERAVVDVGQGEDGGQEVGQG